MGLIGRLLPPDEWPRLSTTQMGETWRQLSPQYSRVRVVEIDGQIVGQWAVLTAVHVEGLGIAEAYQGHPGVARALLHGMVETLQEEGIREVLTQADSPLVEALLEKAGGSKLPGAAWVLPIPEKEA